jgi:hypothetical protein
VTLESNDDATTGVRPSESNGTADCLAARVSETNLFNSGDGGGNFFSSLNLKFVGQAKAGAVLGNSVGDGLRHDGVSVSKDHRTKAQQVVDVLVAVDVR